MNSLHRIAFAFFCLTGLTLAGISCKNANEPTTGALSQRTETTAPTAAKTDDTPEPLFMQEGVLEFRSPAGDKTLIRLDIEIAADGKEQAQGLMWRKKMEDQQGMLFVFSEEKPQSFWMHNTYMPLDIIFVNQRFEVVTILKNVPVLNDAPRPSGKPAMYVIELKAGMADRYGIKEGVKVAWADWTQGKSFGGEITL